MALCTITGTVYLPSGELARSKTIAFRRSDRKITAEYLGVVLPTDVLTRTDVAGLIEVELLTGVYTVFAEGFSALATVPDAETAYFSDIIALAEPVFPAPTWLNQAFEARNEAVAAAGDAAGSADAAALSAAEAAAVGAEAIVIAGAADAKADAALLASAAAVDDATLALSAAGDAVATADAADAKADAAIVTADGAASVASGAQAVAADLAARHYLAISSFQSAVSGGYNPATGTVVTTASVSFVKAATLVDVIPGLPGWVPYGDVYADHFATNTAPGTTDMSGAIQAALNYLSGSGLGFLHLKGHVYRCNTGIVVPKICGVRIKGQSLNKAPGEASDPARSTTEIRAGGPAVTSLFSWSGDEVVTTYSHLAKSFGVEGCIVNGNGHATYLFNFLNVDDFQIRDNRLIGAANILRSVFNGTYSGLNLPGGHRVFDNNFGATSGVNIEIDGHTQDWIRGNWFATTGSAKDVVLTRCDKINLVDNEFNRGSGIILELNDSTGSQATKEITFVANKINGGTATIIADNRTNASSRRIVFAANNIVGGAVIDEEALHNPTSNLISYAKDTESFSFAAAVRGREARFTGSVPVIEARNTSPAVGAGGILRLGHSQDASVKPLMELRSELVNGTDASRTGQVSLWASRAGALAHIMQVDEGGRVGFGTNDPDSAATLTAHTTGATPFTMRRGVAGNVANKITDTVNTLFFGMDTAGDFVVGETANLASGGRLRVTTAGVLSTAGINTAAWSVHADNAAAVAAGLAVNRIYKTSTGEVRAVV